ncbi:transposable element Tcb1 transposase [Trichonephila clavipes]|nr:transposable element Tcb1 transposase [Trichonephila clavipes]
MTVQPPPGSSQHVGLLLQVIPLTANHRLLRLQWAHEPRTWQADWHQVVFSNESSFHLWDHDCRIRFRRYASERCLPECVIERHSDLTPRVMVWGAISYHGRCNFVRIEGNLNSNRYVCEVLQPEVVLLLQGIPGAIFHRIIHAYMLQRLIETSVQPNRCNFLSGLFIH